MKVLRERCDECLYGKHKIVSNARRAEILRELERKDSYFICHKASIAGVDVACRGDFDQRGCGQLGRIMGRLNAIEYVDEADLPKLRGKK